MGTIVLPPQDCFSSHNNRQSHYFPSAAMPDTGRVRSKALMVPLPAAEDCARYDHSGGSPPGDGLLPIPQSHGQARALSKKPTFLPKPSSVLCTPPAARSVVSAACHVKKLSRSVSSILPTPLVGSPPSTDGDGLHLLKGRLPLKVVQGNGPGIGKADVVQHNNSRKQNEARSGASKRMSAANGHAINVKVKGGLQGSRPTSKPLNDGAFMKGQLKKAEEKNDRRLQRSHSVKFQEKCDQNGCDPAITILRRPQSKEAAAELLTKFLQKSVEQAVVSVDEQPVNHRAKGFRRYPETIEEIEVEQQKSRDALSDSELFKKKPVLSVASSCRKADVLSTVMSECLQEFHRVDAGKLAVLPMPETQLDIGSLSPSKGIWGDVCEELVSWERWAGPCYINSPPPSALPLPRFSKRRLTVESLSAPGLSNKIVPERASTTSPSSSSPLYACLYDGHQLGGLNSDAVVTATNDLKRILNLDLCRVRTSENCTHLGDQLCGAGRQIKNARYSACGKLSTKNMVSSRQACCCLMWPLG